MRAVAVAAFLAYLIPSSSHAGDYVLARDQIIMCRGGPDGSFQRDICRAGLSALVYNVPGRPCLPQIDFDAPDADERTFREIVVPLLKWWEAHPEYLDRDVLVAVPAAREALWPCS